MTLNLGSIRSLIRRVIPALLLSSASFILCMIWFTLMADTLADGVTTEILPTPVLNQMIAYYTVVFGPMTWLVKIFILVMLISMTLQLTIKEIPRWSRWLIFITNAPPVFMAVGYIIPLTDHFIENTETPEVLSQLARTIHTAHLISISAVTLMVILQLINVIRLQKEA